MSTSFKSSLPPVPAPPVEAFQYPEVASVAPAEAGLEESDLFPSAQDEMAQLLIRAHSQGAQEAAEKQQAEYSRRVAQERGRITEAMAGFQREVSEYFARIEVEVVQLALGIASKILHREVQAEPASMARIVKSVLGKLHQNTQAKICVRPEEAEGWRELLPHHSEPGVSCEVVVDKNLKPGECRLETALGTAHVGISAQLKEMENGLFDLLAERPTTR